MAKTRRKRQSYSNEKRLNILAAAQKQSLTALDVKKRFGVTPVTYYSWRRKYGASRGAGPAVGRVAQSGIESQVRGEVQSRVRQVLPGIVRSEVGRYLDSLFGSGRGRVRKV